MSFHKTLYGVLAIRNTGLSTMTLAETSFRLHLGQSVGMPDVRLLRDASSADQILPIYGRVKEGYEILLDVGEFPKTNNIYERELFVTLRSASNMERYLCLTEGAKFVQTDRGTKFRLVFTYFICLDLPLFKEILMLPSVAGES